MDCFAEQSSARRSYAPPQTGSSLSEWKKAVSATGAINVWVRDADCELFRLHGADLTIGRSRGLIGRNIS